MTYPVDEQAIIKKWKLQNGDPAEMDSEFIKAFVASINSAYYCGLRDGRNLKYSN